MFPPIVEIYVVWHPGDRAGERIAAELVRHFHGTAFTGLIGGAVETYVRSAGWRDPTDSPRPIPMPSAPPPNGLSPAELTVVVPVLGVELAAEVESGTGAWYDYILRMVNGQHAAPDRVAIFPITLNTGAVDGTLLGRTLEVYQSIRPGSAAPGESEADMRCRELSQGIAQFAGGIGNRPDRRLTVFISYTTRAGLGEHGSVRQFIAQVKAIIGTTRLHDFFAPNDLQSGQDWAAMLRANAATSALLALRTDLYATRAWCQHEMLTAKTAGMPVVILDALGYGEERGSFLMDHVPRVPIRDEPGGGWREADIRRGLNLLVDECLKRVLWRRQQAVAGGRPELNVAWWAPHAPEPLTLAAWLADGDPRSRSGTARILHPDPALGPDERQVLDQLAVLSGLDGLDLLTPRTLAARGG